MPDFNERQKAAINAENPVILASAGAGTGKTTVMTERIVRLIRDGSASLNDMIVITFTREAAHSMREKINEKLTASLKEAQAAGRMDEVDRIDRNIKMLPVSAISTIDSFCSQVVRHGYYIVNAPSSFSIVDDAMRRSYFEQAVHQAVETISGRSYPDKDRKAAFGAFKRGVDASKLVDICLNVYSVLMGVADPFDRMVSLIDGVDLPVQQNVWAQEMFRYYKVALSCKRATLNDLVRLKNDSDFPEAFLPVIQEDINNLTGMLKTVENATTLDELSAAVRKVVDNTAKIRVLRDMSDAEKALYNQFKDIHGTLKNKPVAGSRPMDYLVRILDDISRVGSNARFNSAIKRKLTGLYVLLDEVHKSFTAIKTENAVLDYADLEQYAYRILTSKDNPEVLEEVQKTCKHLFVDECQDISGIQYAIIQALSGGDTSLFMVGDIKQSIYRFRHADPLLFLNLRDAYSEDADADTRKIFFQHNYRSSDMILESVNRVFDECMLRDLTEIDYEDGDHLLPGEDNKPGVPTDILLVSDDFPADPRPCETKNRIEAQCREVGEQIRDLVNQGYEYKDIVILLRSAKQHGTEVVNWLSKMHIPSFYNGKQNFYDVPEVAQLIEILRVIDNPRSDISLLSALTGVPFNFTPEELGTIRSLYSAKATSSVYDCFATCAEKNTTTLEKKAHDALELIHEWQLKAQISPSSDIIWMVLRQYGFYATQGAMPAGDIRRKNLDAFHQKALECEKNGILRLPEFLDYIKILSRVKASTGDDPIPMSDNDDFVRVMTIHASKGLEFPVVFIMDMQRSIHSARTDKSGVLVSVSSNATKPALGFYVHDVDNGKHRRHISYGESAFRTRAYMDDLAEETRLLYVAMTRAKARLFLVGVAKRKSMPYWTDESREHRIFNSDSHLDMVMPAVLKMMDMPEINHDSAGDVWRITYREPQAIPDTGNNSAVNSNVVMSVPNDVDFEKEWAELKPVRVLPAKTSVTAVLSDNFSLVRHTEEQEPQNADVEQESVHAMALPSEPEKPAFMTAETDRSSASIGSIVHKFMFLINFANFAPNVPTIKYVDVLNQELSTLVDCGTLSSKDRDIVTGFIYGISRFLQTKVGQALISNPKALRERSVVFSRLIDSQPVLVQGIIDALYQDENGEWVIIDYKTDQDASRDALIDKHSRQINLYRYAVEGITGCSVSRMYVASLRTGETVEIPKLD